MKKTVIMILSFLAFVMICRGTIAVNAATPTITDNGNGTVTINFTNDTSLKVKILATIASTGYKQQYDMASGVSVITIPLTGGNETYTIKVCRQTEGSKYSVVGKTDISLNLKDKNQVYLYANTIVNFKQSDEILKRAAELTHGCKTEEDIVKAVHDYIVKNFVYNYNLSSKITAGSVTNYVPDVQQVYRAKTGICYDYSVVMASMLRSRGIQVRVITGYPDPSMVNGYHAWLQIYDPVSKSWYTCDPTYDSCFYHKGYSYTIKKNYSQYSNITYMY